jgi:hypothetical protein
MITELAQRYEYIASIYNDLDEKEKVGVNRERFERAHMEMNHIIPTILFSEPEDDNELFVMAAFLRSELHSFFEDIESGADYSGYDKKTRIKASLCAIDEITAYLASRSAKSLNLPALCDYIGATEEGIEKFGFQIGQAPHSKFSA